MEINLDGVLARTTSKRRPRAKSMTNNAVDHTEKLPDSLLYNILQLLPSESLRYKVKYVCKRWLNIITNEILSEVATVIIQRPLSKVYCYETRLVNFCVEDNNLKGKEQSMALPCKGRIRSSCDELLLVTDPDMSGVLHIYNYTTKVGRTLPRRGSMDCGGHRGRKCGLALVVDKFRGIHKIVHVFVGKLSVQCEIFDLENELLFSSRSRWRKIEGPSYVGQREYYLEDPISVNGRYLHWDVCSPEYILSMDIADEKFYQVPLPIPASSFSLLEMGGYLCLYSPNVSSSDASKMYILNHIKNGAWRRLEGIFADDHPLRHPEPVTVLRSGEHIVYKRRGIYSVFFGCNVRTGREKNLDITIGPDERCSALSTDFGG